MAIMIDRAHIMKQFASYTDEYDSADEKIKLKIDRSAVVRTDRKLRGAV